MHAIISLDIEESICESVEDMPQDILNDLRLEYQVNSIVRLDVECIKSILPTATTLRQWTEEVSYESDLKKDTILRTYEKTSPSTRSLIRLEHFVHSHPGWSSLCSTSRPLSKLVGMVCTPQPSDNPKPYPLYKEKLNLKPPSGSGFAPHLDAPSLRVVNLGSDFVTVMVAIDDMTVKNGCLRVVRGEWNEGNRVECEVVDGGNPDGDGRRGAIPADVSDGLEWEDVVCKGGSVYVFNGWVPHRSKANGTRFGRRGVFLTYNTPEDGELREAYYERMRSMREEYKRENVRESEKEVNNEADWLKSVPT